jgi:alkylation response protein AidB-like acyl-CoA dehydrogenase
MQFGLSESQQILKSNARKFFAAECPMSEVRRILETETAYDAGLWSKMAGQGYTGIIFPEQHGGLGEGKVELALLMEEMGRALVPGPFFSTIAAATVLDRCGSAEQKREFLEPVCHGDARAALALVEGPGSPDPARVRMTAHSGALTGEKLFVADAAAADILVVVGAGGVYAVRAGASGLKIEPMNGMDLTRKIYAVEFESTPATPLAALAGLERALDIATVALAAELVGGMQRVVDLGVEYAKTRKQFGKAIGQFQAVQHQLADSYLETESSRSAAYYAAWALEQDVPDAATAVSIAKMYASDAARNVGNRGIQVQGGMGFTWENDAHLYYRRFKASETAFGDATYHRERIARMVIDRAAAAVA